MNLSPSQKTMSLSCLSHVKRVPDADGNLFRPPSPALIVVTEVVVDRSGSMKKLGSAPTEGLLGFIGEQKRLARETGAQVYFSLTSFDDTAETWIDNVPIDQVNPSSAELVGMIFPRGRTLLVDTLYARLCGLSIKVRSIVQSLPREIRDLKPKITVVCVAITDGKDNESKLCTDADLNALITKKRGEGFAILFLAANQDAIQTAKKWGIAADCANTFGATEEKARACFKSASAAAARTSSGFAPRFTKRERQSTAPATAPRLRRQGGGGGGAPALFQQPASSLWCFGSVSAFYELCTTASASCWWWWGSCGSCGSCGTYVSAFACMDAARWGIHGVGMLCVGYWSSHSRTEAGEAAPSEYICCL